MDPRMNFPSREKTFCSWCKIFARPQLKQWWTITEQTFSAKILMWFQYLGKYLIFLEFTFWFNIVLENIFYEASEFCLYLYNIWGSVLSRWICDWEPPQNNRPSQDQAKTNQVSEENKSFIVSSKSGNKNTQKLLFLFLQFAETHNKILTDFLQKVAICQTDVPDHASTTPTHPRSDQSPSTVRITKTRIEFYKADDALSKLFLPPREISEDWCRVRTVVTKLVRLLM